MKYLRYLTILVVFECLFNGLLCASPKPKDHCYLLIPSIGQLSVEFWAVWEIPEGKWKNSYASNIGYGGNLAKKHPTSNDEWVMETLSWEFTKRKLNIFLSPELQKVTPEMLKLFDMPKDWSEEFWDHVTTNIQKPSGEWPDSVYYLQAYCDAFTRFYGRNTCFTCPCPATAFGSHILLDKPLAILVRAISEQDIKNFYDKLISQGDAGNFSASSADVSKKFEEELRQSGFKIKKLEIDTTRNFILVRTNQDDFLGFFTTLFSPY